MVSLLCSICGTRPALPTMKYCNTLVRWGSPSNYAYDLSNPSKTKEELNDASVIFNLLLLGDPAPLDASVLFSERYDRFRAVRFLPRALELRPDLVNALGIIPMRRILGGKNYSAKGNLLHWLVLHSSELNSRYVDEPLVQKHEIMLVLSAMRLLISLGIAIDSSAEATEHNQPVTPLAFAVQLQFCEGVDLLLDARADPNATCAIDLHAYPTVTIRGSVLMKAAQCLLLPSFKSLIKASANVNDTTSHGHTALTMLLQHRTHTHYTSPWTSYLGGESASPGTQQMLKLLIDSSADCNCALSSGVISIF